tara:strand:- start:25139 stop:25726 length:588 start_codon:yes stop_codon:yes gene_type:complete
MNSLIITRVKGKEAHEHLHNLAALRIEIFKEYPYLYQGDLDYELTYLKTYLNSLETNIVLVKDEDKIIGYSTAIPLIFESAACQKPFIENNFALEKYFYLGESILLPEYRNRGVYRKFFEEREMAAKEYGCSITTFCAIHREKNDVRRPKEYSSLNPVWQYFGYKKNKLWTEFSWVEIGQKDETINRMLFWEKKI